MTEKREFGSSVGINNSATGFSSNPANKIFIRKDLVIDSKSSVLPPAFSLSDLGLLGSKTTGEFAACLMFWMARLLLTLGTFHILVSNIVVRDRRDHIVFVSLFTNAGSIFPVFM